MAFDIENKLVIAIASSAVLTLDAARDAFREHGLEAYRKYQREHQHDVLEKGPAFAFVKRLLNFNRLFPEQQPVEVVLVSHNDSDTGLRIMNSLKAYDLDISRAAFITQESPYRYLDAYNASLFLSKNSKDVEAAIRNGYAAGTVLPSTLNDDPEDDSLRVAFDFDGVLADPSSEMIYKGQGLAGFHQAEAERAEIPCSPGPLADLFRKLSRLRELEVERSRQDPSYRRRLSLSIVTARSAPAHERVVSTLRKWNITTDQTFFLGGVNKGRILSALRPHIFFDDQEHPHLDAARDYTPSVHIPIGCAFGQSEPEPHSPEQGEQAK